MNRKIADELMDATLGLEASIQRLVTEYEHNTGTVVTKCEIIRGDTDELVTVLVKAEVRTTL